MGAVALAARIPERDTARAMSEENAMVGVRIRPHGLKMRRQHRSLDERLFVRFPALYRSFAAFWSRLPKHSRLRRLILMRVVAQATSAANRRDFDVLLTGFDPAIDFRMSGTAMFPPDLMGRHYGHSGYRELWRKMLEAFEDLTLESEELIDLGDRLFSVTRMTGHGAGSGVPINDRIFQVFTFHRGLVAKQEDFGERAEALEAAGLKE
jgi:SnoaL-like protein